MEYEAFVKYKTRIFQKQEEKTIIFNDINVIPYPNTKDLYLITFKEFYSSQSYKFTGDKILMVKANDKGHFEIITEK
jgi:murein L,D-transpeptidase YafK